MKFPNPRCNLVTVPKPRELKPIFIEGKDQFGDYWYCKLEKISMETVRKEFGFPEIHEDTYKNLQIWLNHLGPALYNPVWWRFHPISLAPRRTRYPHRIGHYEILHGCHRARALERCDFPYVYALIHYGRTYWNPSNPNWQKQAHKLNVNDVEPITYTIYGRCDKCGNKVKWSGPPKSQGGTNHYKATIYKCNKCGYIGERPEIYPEPM